MTLGNRLMEADLETSEGSVRVEAIHPLFRLRLPSFLMPNFDATADGSRFLVDTSGDPERSQSMGLLLN